MTGKTYMDIVCDNGRALASLPLSLQRKVVDGKLSLADAVRLHYGGKPFDDVCSELYSQEGGQ